MKIAIVGSSGYIANFLLDRFEKEKLINSVLKIDVCSEADIYLDLLHPEDFDYELLRGVDFIVFTAAVSSPDQCAEQFNHSWAINVIGTSYFITKAIHCQCKVLFFSSDAVFEGNPMCIYTEDKETNAFTAYGHMKKAVEDMFRGNRYFKVIRLSYVISAKDKFVKYCIQCIRNKETARIFHPFYRNCIVISDVVEVVIWFIYHWEEYMPFVLNVAGNELVSRIRIADELNRYFQDGLNYIVIQPDNEFFKNRPRITQMVSLYALPYKILDNSNFTVRIRNELKGIKI